MSSTMALSILGRYIRSPNAASVAYDACILGQVNIDVTVTSVNAVVDDYLTSVKSSHELAGSLMVGFDMELVPTEDEMGINTIHLIATINFCIGRRVLIYHLPYLPYNVLEPFFSDQSNVFVGVGVKAQLKKLQAVYGVGGNARYVDLGERAAELYNRPELKKAELRVLATTVLGKDVSKPEVSNEFWENDLLSPSQVLHACVDAFVSHELGQAMVGPTPRSVN